MAIVDKAGAGVLVVRIALTDLVPTNVADSLVGTAVPYGFAAEVASGAATGLPAGATPYLGETGIEVQFRDGASASVIAECADTEVGRKYAADMSWRRRRRASVDRRLCELVQQLVVRQGRVRQVGRMTARRVAMLRGS